MNEDRFRGWSWDHEEAFLELDHERSGWRKEGVCMTSDKIYYVN
jgi:hypothetical protein